MPKPPPYKNPHAPVAKARALKHYNNLFKPTNFTAIMNALEPGKNKNAFNTACNNAGLTVEETDWLWNYLKECNTGLWGDPNVPDASAGW